MLYLVTGLTQTGKTCNAIQWVLEHSQRSNRPVCHNGRFIAQPGSDLSRWTRADMRHWQDQPDGSVFFVDACHHDFPARRPGQEVPEHIRALVQHDKRGMDFYLITQHPGSVDSFVLDQVHPPGWHRHLLRTPGTSIIRCLEWGQANLLCAHSGSEAGALVTTLHVGNDAASAALRPAAPKAAKLPPAPQPDSIPPLPLLRPPASAAPAAPVVTRQRAAPEKPAAAKPAPQQAARLPLLLAALARGGKVAAGALLRASMHTGRWTWRAMRLALHAALQAARHRRKNRQPTPQDDLGCIRPSVHGPAEETQRRFAPWMVAVLLLGAGAAALGWRMWAAPVERISLPGLGELSLPSPGTPGKTAAGDAKKPDADSSWRGWIPLWVPFVHNNETVVLPHAGGGQGGSGGAQAGRRGQEQQPLSCVAKEDYCRCFNPQGVRMQVSDTVCRQIVLQEDP